MLPLSQVENESDFGRLRITRLWTHEILRVFGDRLVDVADEKILFESMRVAVSTHFQENFDALFSHLNMKDTKLWRSVNMRNRRKYAMNSTMKTTIRTSSMYNYLQATKSFVVILTNGFRSWTNI